MLARLSYEWWGRVTAHAEPAGSRLRGTITRYARVLLAGASLTLSTSADAQVGALISVYNDYRFRGVSLSGSRPVGIVDLSYDLRNGLYAALSGRVVATRDEGLKPLGLVANAGYATRLGPNTTADFGVVHSRYSHYSGLDAGRSYTEVYSGFSGKFMGARLSVSPDYLGNARWTAYGNIYGHLSLSTRTVIEGEIGALSGLGSHYRGIGRPQFDARLGVDHRLGPVSLHAALTAHGQHYLYSGPTGRHLALVVGVSTGL